MNFGVIPASAHEMAVRSAMSVLGIDGAIIPYKDFGERYTGRITGTLSATIHANLPQVQSGQGLPLAMGGEKCPSEMPNLPTFRDLG